MNAYNFYKKNISVEDIFNNGQSLIAEIEPSLKKKHKYIRETRYFGFENLKKNWKNGLSKIRGIVANYKIKHYPKYSMIYLLLLNVQGRKSDGSLFNITDHLWIDINAVKYLYHIPKISCGDVISLSGFVYNYHGYLGRIKHRVFFGNHYKEHHWDLNYKNFGRKYNFKPITVNKVGYPQINSNDQITKIIPYNHGNHYLIYSDNPLSPINYSLYNYKTESKYKLGCFLHSCLNSITKNLKKNNSHKHNKKFKKKRGEFKKVGVVIFNKNGWKCFEKKKVYLYPQLRKYSSMQHFILRINRKYTDAKLYWTRNISQSRDYKKYDFGSTQYYDINDIFWTIQALMRKYPVCMSRIIFDNGY